MNFRAGSVNKIPSKDSTSTMIFKVVNPIQSYDYSKLHRKYDEEIANRFSINKNPNDPTYIKIYLDFAYFTCWSPFRLKNNGSLEIVQANPVMLFVHFILLIFRLLWDLVLLRLVLLEINDTQGDSVVITYFKLVDCITFVFWPIISVRVLWIKQDAFLKLHKLILKSSVCQDIHNHVWLKFALIYLMHQGIGVLLFPATLDIESGGDPWTLFNGLVFSGKLFVLEPNPNMTNFTTFSAFSPWEITQAFGTLIGVLIVKFQDFQGLIIMFSCSILLWEACSTFEKSWKNKDNSVSVIFEQYYELKELSNTLKECIGQLNFLNIVNLIVYLATRFDSLFVLSQDWILWLSFAHEFFQASVFLIISCEAKRKMDAFREWLLIRKNRTLLDNSELQWFLADLSIKSVAVSGNGLFTVDYTFLGNTLSVLVTYFIVVIQARVQQS